MDIHISLLFEEGEKRIRHGSVTYIGPLTAIFPPISFLVTRRRGVYVCAYTALKYKNGLRWRSGLCMRTEKQPFSSL
jgi:hypothetical protein